jgi:spermidine synthase
MRADRQLFSGRSAFQRIDVFDTMEFGRVLVIDGYIMCTEKDEFIYHEMIAHVPMAVRPDTRNILVIGAGDGGTVRELTRYAGVERIDMVEIDEMVVSVCREYLQQTACRLDDGRVRIFYQDGVEFVRRKENEYDLIIVDSTDPEGPGEGLFTREFYENCCRALKGDGILVNQHESPFYPDEVAAMQLAHRRIAPVFPISEVYQAHIPTYASGHWLFGFASKKYHPVRDFDPEKWNALGLKTRYYNTRLHVGAFALPNYVEELLREAEQE